MGSLSALSNTSWCYHHSTQQRVGMKKQQNLHVSIERERTLRSTATGIRVPINNNNTVCVKIIP